MYVYKDFSYVEYILELDIREALKLYFEALKRVKNKEEKEFKRYIYDMWLLEIQNGLKMNFKDYYQKSISTSEQSNMTYEDKNKEEENIINKVLQKTKNTEMVDRRFVL